MQVRQELNAGATGAIYAEQIELALVKIDTCVIIDILFFKASFIVWSRYNFIFPFCVAAYVVSSNKGGS